MRASSTLSRYSLPLILPFLRRRKIDELYIWREVKNSTFISNLYNSGTATFYRSSYQNSSILFQSPSPTINSAIFTDYFNISANISIIDILRKVNITFNGDSSTIYHSNDLVFLMNADNNTNLGDNLTLVADSSRYNNSGILKNGATYTSSGKINGGITFDGYND